MTPLPFNPIILLLLALIAGIAVGMAISALRGTRPRDIPPYELRETRRGRRR